MSLDLFASNIDDAVNYAGRVSAPELPSTFSDNFDDAFARGRLVSSSVSGSLRRSRALSDYMDEVTAKSGTSLQMMETVDGAPSVAELGERVRQIKATNPNLDIADLTDEEIQRRADEIGKRQLADSQALDRRERTTGGAVGSFLGAAGAAVTDPVNMIAFPLAAPESLGILGTALAWSAIGAGSQTAIEVLNSQNMERIQPGYTTSAEPLRNIAETALVSGVLGGSLKGLSNLWTKAKTGDWPRTVRDAGNVVESEAQIAGTNPLPGIEGEAAHRTALSKAIDDLANGRAVDVDGIVSGDMLGNYEMRHAQALDAMSEVYVARNAITMERAAQDVKVQPELPFAGSIAEGQEVAAIAKLGQTLEDVAESIGTKLAPEEGRKLAEKISRMSTDDAQVALDEFFLRPNTLLETLPEPRRPVKPVIDRASPDAVASLRDELTPAKIEEARVSPDMEETISRDLDKLMLERPDLEVPTGVTVDADGRTVPTTRKIESVINEADNRLAAAKEIEACVGPYPPEAAE
jgi:hypothetical protein